MKAPYTLSVEVHGRFGAIWVAVFDGQEAIAMPDTIGTMFSIKLPKTIDEIGLFSDVVNATIDIIKAEIK
ncbi:MAG: hypothetical protein P8J14_04855 [Emcibacteraceae bacterium]|nr:hypothetical protein [Emcibacteraceae bacterium]